MNKPFPARIHAIFASDAPLALVLRKGPSKRVCTFLWNRDKDTFTQGQWLKGRIYERRCDLSPNGKYFLYFAMNGKWGSEVKGSWTAISRAPWLKAIALYAKGDCWEGGGLFLSKNSYWINDRYFNEENTLQLSSELHQDKSYIPEKGYSGQLHNIRFGAEDTGVYYRRLLRDGWSPSAIEGVEQSPNITVFEKKLNKSWVLVKIAHSGFPEKEGRGCYWDEHRLLNRHSGMQIDHNNWEWAEVDNNNIVWAAGGCLYRSSIKSTTDIGHPRLLYDFNGLHFEEITAPY